MSDMEAKLNAEFDAWFAKVKALTLETIEPDDLWAEFWFDGFTPEEAVQENGAKP